MSLLPALDTPTLPRHRPPPRDARQVCRLLQVATATAFGVPVGELRARSRRSAEVAFARQSAMYLAHVVLGLTYDAVGLSFRRDRTTAAHACRRVEDRRDDPAIDRMLQMLETVCGELARAARVLP
jgi:chromosomal replication initiation ATPase DnaA